VSWWQLQAIKQTQQAWERSYYAERPVACPNDGTPLESAYVTQRWGGQMSVLHCPMGDYSYTSGRRET
jgi:hypothetical protein